MGGTYTDRFLLRLTTGDMHHENEITIVGAFSPGNGWALDGTDYGLIGMGMSISDRL